jgi:uncharacterized membrane protein
MSDAADIMLFFFGLLSLLVGLFWLLMPIVSWIRTSRLQREVELLRTRIASLEGAIAATSSAPAPLPAPAPAAAPPPAPASEQVPAPALARAAAADTLPTPDVVPPPLPYPQPQPSTAPASAESGSLEDAIGGRLMLWVGTVVLVLGVAFFLKYAFDNEWITESMRVLLGLAAGGGLIAAGHRFAARGYRAYGQILGGGGIAVLFLSIYAAYNFYGLIGQVTAFSLLVLVTAGAAAIADRQQALGLAIMAVGGGFLTPFLVGSGTDAQITLFTYDALLVVGTLYLANRQDWPGLNALSYAFAVLTIGAWMVEYSTAAKWLRTELFLTLFCVLFLLILRAQLTHTGWRSTTSWILATAPLLYHVTSLVILEPHGVAVWVYLIAVTMAAVGLAVRAESISWRLAAWAAVVLPLMAWIDSHQASRWLTANLVSATAIFAMHALAQLDRSIRHEKALSVADNVLQHLNGYALIASLYAAVEQVWLSSAAGLSVAVAAVHALIAWRLWHGDRGAALHAVAVGVGAVTVALALELDGPWLTAALAIEGALVSAIGRHMDVRGFRLGGAGLIAAAVFRYVDLSLQASPATFHPVASEPFAMGLTLAAILYGLGWFYRRHERERAPRYHSGTTLSVIVASVLVVVACSAHTWDYWRHVGMESADARFAYSLSLSGLWTVLACVFIGAGLVRAFAPLRYLAMALFGITVLKVFLVDLSSLGGIYRILGFIGVGMVLLAVSFLYQRGRVKPRSGQEPQSGSATEAQSDQSSG